MTQGLIKILLPFSWPLLRRALMNAGRVHALITICRKSADVELHCTLRAYLPRHGSAASVATAPSHTEPEAAQMELGEAGSR